jgi:hypothetical protein
MALKLIDIAAEIRHETDNAYLPEWLALEKGFI